MLVKSNITARGTNEVYCKYEMANGNHYVYFESNGAVRKLQLPSYTVAQDLFHNLEKYKRLRVKL